MKKFEYQVALHRKLKNSGAEVVRYTTTKKERAKDIEEVKMFIKQNHRRKDFRVREVGTRDWSYYGW
jgi:4-hydroxy-3-methylbut-2-en-1-yl diphosphate synthase IspG/GcpE